jgi:hypothetical protein
MFRMGRERFGEWPKFVGYKVAIIQWLTSQSRQLKVWLGCVLANVDDNMLLDRQLEYKVMMFLGNLLRLGNFFKIKDLDFIT